MKRLFNVFVVAFCLAGMYSCSGDCTTTIDHIASITNTLVQPVSVEFRAHNNMEQQMTITLEPGQSTETFFYTSKEVWTPRVPWASCEDHYKSVIEALIFSNETLDQYTICHSPDFTYAVLASGATCTGDSIQEFGGW